jgi:hypothetical protein
MALTDPLVEWAGRADGACVAVTLAP